MRITHKVLKEYVAGLNESGHTKLRLDTTHRNMVRLEVVINHRAICDVSGFMSNQELYEFLKGCSPGAEAEKKKKEGK